jgi:hypothetical protein
MSSRFKKILLLLLAALLLCGVSQVQQSMNRDRDRLELTRVQPLENAPPVLALTTVALGGFRGLISNLLWIRANELQDDDKFFEMAQLADWITKLEPSFVNVWVVQAWNMSYNISVKFTDFQDRWRWVQRGIELLRDEGLRYNPNELLIYRELAWHFQHKMGANLDDASMYYKEQWAIEMTAAFGKGQGANFEALIHPKTEDEKARAELLKTRFKMDPAIMKQVDELYGPLEWRLPEAHSIYWAFLGLKAAEQNPSKIKKDDIMTLRRVIYQSMQLSFQRGHLVANPFLKTEGRGHGYELGPNLDIIPKASESYELQAAEEPNSHDHILRGHRNFLRQAVFYLYEHNRRQEAAYWFKYLGDKYPNDTIVDNDPKSFPRNLTLDQYAVACVQQVVGESNHDSVTAAIEGLLVNSYSCLAMDRDDEAFGYKMLARQLWSSYMSKIPETRVAAIGLDPLDAIDREVRQRMLNPKNNPSPEFRAVLLTKLGLPPQTNAPPETLSPGTNAPATNTNAPVKEASRQ